jgi:hypothetical protein
MGRPNHPVIAKAILLAALISFPVAGVELRAANEADSHRPACANAQCRKTKSFLKTHYCGESPYGNGPDDGCLITPPKKLRAEINVRADFNCAWSESKQTTQCQQKGEPSNPALLRWPPPLKVLCNRSLVICNFFSPIDVYIPWWLYSMHGMGCRVHW